MAAELEANPVHLLSSWNIVKNWKISLDLCFPTASVAHCLVLSLKNLCDQNFSGLLFLYAIL